MGTRHLTAVMKDNEYKVAQYGQWDGYPSGQGVDILNFLHSLRENIYSKQFLAKLDGLTFITDGEIDEINKRIESEKISNWQSIWPELSRDTGGKILELIMNAESPMKLRNGIDFAADSLFCEYAYVIDFDKKTFEVFQGFNQDPLQETDRFYGYIRDGRQNEYHPVRLIRSYQLDLLPTPEAFLADLDVAGDSEE